MIHHVGVVWLRLERAGCRVRPGEHVDDLDVWGDRDDVYAVLQRWDGEGPVALVAALVGWVA